MKIKKWNEFGLLSLFVMLGFIQQAQAQKEVFFHHFNWNQTYLSPAGTGAEGFTANSLYRNFNDSTNYYFSIDVPVKKLNSALGFYHLHNSSGPAQNMRTGLSYTGFISFGQNSSLRLGVQGNRHQNALSHKTWALREYQTDTVYYTADASLFLQRGKLSLGLAAHHLLPSGMREKQTYLILIGFNELRTSSWLRSSPSMLMQLKPSMQLPELRFNYTATIANFLMVGSSYYKNSAYLYGFNAGFKLFNRIWLTAATDFVDTKLPYRAIYEFGLRINFGKRQKFTNTSEENWEEEEEYQLQEKEVSLRNK